MTTGNLFATGASLMVLIEIWIKIEALTILAKGAKLTFMSRLMFSLATALICFIALKASSYVVGVFWGLAVLWVVEHAMLLVYAWHFTPAVRTAAFWQELVEVRVPQWICTGCELSERLKSKAEALWQFLSSRLLPLVAATRQYVISVFNRTV